MLKKLLLLGAIAFFIFGPRVGYVFAQEACGPGVTCSSVQICDYGSGRPQCIQNPNPAGGTTSGGTTPGVSIKLTNPLGNDCNFPCLVGRITGLFLDVAAPIAVIMVLIGGFIMATSTGDPEKFKKGQKTLLYSAIGLAVILAAQSIPALIKNILGS